MQLANYLFFTTHCEPALAFYSECGLGRVTLLVRHGERGLPVHNEAMRGKVMHAKFEGPGVEFYASDNDDAEPMRGSAHMLTMNDREQTRTLFEKLASGGRITDRDVDGEIARLQADWQRDAGPDPGDATTAAPVAARADDDVLRELLAGRLDAIDRFDRVQLAAVVRCCRRHRSLSAAGRELFAVSRQQRATSNDADRLRKYLLRFGLDFATTTARG